MARERRQLDLTNENINPFKVIAWLAWPVFVEQILATLVSFADTAMVGALGPSATASVSISNSVVFLLNGAVMALGIGITAYVARSVGAKDYEAAREKWLMKDEYASIRAKVDTFMQARANFEANQNDILAKGGQLYDIVCYDLPMMIPLTAEYKTSNTDCILHVESTSMGATIADLGETLGEDYKAAGTYCNNPAHNHLSPDGMVDATTGLLPCTTWYFKGQAHELLPYNDVALKLSIRLMTDNNMVDVYSNPVAYPQFNSYRLNNTINLYREAWSEFDKSKLNEDQIAPVEAALAKIVELENETVIDDKAWTAAQDGLENALVLAGVIEDPNPTCIENVLTKLLKGANDAINTGYEIMNK